MASILKDAIHESTTRIVNYQPKNTLALEYTRPKLS